MTRNIQEAIEAPAKEFEQVRQAILRLRQRKPVDPSRQNKCPKCRIPLGKSFYEGVAVRTCRQCGGKLVDSDFMHKILLRRELAFSEGLIQKARDFKEKFLLNPHKAMKAKSAEARNLYCPDCGYRMKAKPYNYQYFIPVDKCLSCYKIWFDADELEVLQILVEKLV